MHYAAGGHADADPVESDLPDVTALPLADLVGTDHAALSNALRRILDDIDEPPTIAGWQSHLP